MTKRFVTELPRPAEQVDSPLGKARTSLIALVQNNASLLASQSPQVSVKSFVDGISKHFDNEVAVAVQTRETEYVNTMTNVFQQEMDNKKAEVAALVEKNNRLKTQLQDLSH